MVGLRESFGRLLRNVRRARGLTILDVDQLTTQQRCRVPRSRLSMIERGESPIRFDDLMGLSRAYGFTLLDLCVEAVAAHPDGLFSEEWTAQMLFEEGKKLFDAGNLLEAGWAFDTASEKAAAGDHDLVALARISACHCYDRAGAKRLAMRRNEQALDILDDESDLALRTISKRAVLLASTNSPIRARIYLETTLAALENCGLRELRAYLLGSSASAFYLLGKLDEAAEQSLKAARLYRQLGEFDWSGLKLAAAATYFAQLGKLEVATRHVRDAQGLLDDLTRVDTRIFVFLALGEVLTANGAMSEARGWLETAYRLAESHDMPARAREAGELLARLAEESDNPAELRRWRGRLKRLPCADLETVANIREADQLIFDPERGRMP